jgi:hypothetical protein
MQVRVHEEVAAGVAVGMGSLLQLQWVSILQHILLGLELKVRHHN